MCDNNAESSSMKHDCVKSPVPYFVLFSNSINLCRGPKGPVASESVIYNTCDRLWIIWDVYRCSNLTWLVNTIRFDLGVPTSVICMLLLPSVFSFNPILFWHISGDLLYCLCFSLLKHVTTFSTQVLDFEFYFDPETTISRHMQIFRVRSENCISPSVNTFW
jgi:hypothetical protein